MILVGNAVSDFRGSIADVSERGFVWFANDRSGGLTERRNDTVTLFPELGVPVT